MIVKMKCGVSFKIDKEDLEALRGWAFYPHIHRGNVYVAACKWNPNTHQQINKRLHRLVLNEPTGMVCHLNGDGLDCRKKNLAIGNHHQNGVSFRRKRSGSASGFRGVHINNGGGKRWTVMFIDSGKYVYLGRFNSEVKAAAAYDREAKRRFGKWAHLNFTRTTTPKPSSATEL